MCVCVCRPFVSIRARFRAQFHISILFYFGSNSMFPSVLLFCVTIWYVFRIKNRIKCRAAATQRIKWMAWKWCWAPFQKRYLKLRRIQNEVVTPNQYYRMSNLLKIARKTHTHIHIHWIFHDSVQGKSTTFFSLHFSLLLPLLVWVYRFWFFERNENHIENILTLVTK